MAKEETIVCDFCVEELEEDEALETCNECHNQMCHRCIEDHDCEPVTSRKRSN